ncbi:universal stress protein [Fulvivirgaceae bacterium BMA10]|uniref:Universal stress protein n=1 Tax=Splendidivirga corallicola TaxID=3051826 RepID=A0ABT8KYP2_9BACT|nr:universal stress protein [Fulvivirgaceae bacterium BMA10]
MKIKNILVPIDFSECSINALKYALAMSHEIKSKVTVIHSYHVPLPSTDISFTLDADSIEDYKKKVLEDFAALKSMIHGLNQANFKVIIAYAIDAILMSVENFSTDLIIMGTKGASGISKTFLGSVSTSVVKKSKVPVLVIPADQTFKPFNKIAFACDYGNMQDPLGLDLLKTFALLFDSSIHIVNVNTGDGTRRDESPHAINVLNNSFQGAKFSYHDIANEDIVEGINRYIQSHEIDLLSVMPRKHRIIEKILKPSVSKKIVQHTHLPMLTFHEE